MSELENKKIVLIGGGTGNAVLLRSLKKYTENISVIVSVGRTTEVLRVSCEEKWA